MEEKLEYVPSSNIQSKLSDIKIDELDEILKQKSKYISELEDELYDAYSDLNRYKRIYIRMSYIILIIGLINLIVLILK